MRNNKGQKILSILIIIFLVVFLAIPIISLFIKAFQNSDGNFVGLENFTSYLATRGFKVALKNSLLVSITATIISMTLAFIYAYGINRTNIKRKGLFQWLALLP